MGGSTDLTTQGMNRVNGFQNRWPADLVICAFQSFLNAKAFYFSSLIIWSVFLLFSHWNPHPTSHDTARGIIIGYVQRSMLTFSPGLWDRRGPVPCLSIKSGRASGGIVAEGCWLTGHFSPIVSFFFCNSNFILQSNTLATMKSVASMHLLLLGDDLMPIRVAKDFWAVFFRFIALPYKVNDYQLKIKSNEVNIK